MKYLLLLGFLIAANLHAQEPQFIPTNFDVSITPNFVEKSVLVDLTMKYTGVISKEQLLAIAKNLTIKTFEWNKADSTVHIIYSGSPRGLVWSNDLVYTNYSSCTWLLCPDRSGARASHSIHMITPADYTTVSTTGAVKTSPYLMGFAAGKLFARSKEHNGVSLKVFAPTVSSFTATILERTAEMIDIISVLLDTPFPRTEYLQVIVPNNEAQEKANLSFLGSDYLSDWEKDPQDDWLVSHELIHQWIGNSITCKDWNHFWLNEGITVFLTAAYKEKKWGREQYDREMELAAKKWQLAKEAQFDVPLTYEGVYPSLQIKRAITYSKGALFMDYLRKDLGEKVFWKALQTYTREMLNHLATTGDFQKIFERVSNRDLSQEFKKFAY